MAAGSSGPGPSREARGEFERVADAIMYRWSVERDVWVSPVEVERVRAYLRGLGIVTTELADGRFVVEGRPESPLEAARLILLGLRHVLETRRARRDP